MEKLKRQLGNILTIAAITAGADACVPKAGANPPSVAVQETVEDIGRQASAPLFTTLMNFLKNSVITFVLLILINRAVFYVSAYNFYEFDWDSTIFSTSLFLFIAILMSPVNVIISFQIRKFLAKDRLC